MKIFSLLVIMEIELIFKVCKMTQTQTEPSNIKNRSKILFENMKGI